VVRQMGVVVPVSRRTRFAVDAQSVRDTDEAGLLSYSRTSRPVQHQRVVDLLDHPPALDRNEPRCCVAAFDLFDVEAAPAALQRAP